MARTSNITKSIHRYIVESGGTIASNSLLDLYSTVKKSRKFIRSQGGIVCFVNRYNRYFELQNGILAAKIDNVSDGDTDTNDDDFDIDADAEPNATPAPTVATVTDIDVRSVRFRTSSDASTDISPRPRALSADLYNILPRPDIETLLRKKQAVVRAGYVGIDRDTETDFHFDHSKPFCFVTVGNQGTGKSHSLGVMIENCLGIRDERVGHDVVGDVVGGDSHNIKNGTASLILHYDTSNQNICEAVGIGQSGPSGNLPEQRNMLNKPIVYVSPSYYHQRKTFYGDTAIVKPLLFNWSQLQASQIKKLMRLEANSTQLYIGVMLSLLRKYQRMNVIPSFASFCAELRGTFESPSQAVPLNQRLMLLDSFLTETEINAEFAVGYLATNAADTATGPNSAESSDGRVNPTNVGPNSNPNSVHSILSDIKPNQLIVVDLTDPLLSPDEAESIFEVVLEDFQNQSVPSGKLVALDEAHKYMSSKSGLSNAIVMMIRLMRHEGTRILISTQSPMCLPVEVLELSSLVAIHRFHSSDWFEYLRKKIHLPKDVMDEIRELETGHAIVFDSLVNRIFRAKIRQRYTMDLGFSRD